MKKKTSNNWDIFKREAEIKAEELKSFSIQNNKFYQKELNRKEKEIEKK